MRDVGVLLGLLAMIVVVYSGVGHFQFVNWDDNVYVFENRHVLAGLSWSNVWWALTTAHTPYWHPLTWLSHMMDVTLFGLDAGRHHLTSVVLHALNTLLVFWFFRTTTGAVGRSGLLAAIFAVHPVHVESVAWVTERKDVLSACFLLLTLIAYAGYVKRPRWPRYIGVTALFIAALMSKPMVVTLPALLLLIDVWPLARVSWTSGWPAWWPLIREKLPLFVLAFGTSAATIVVQARVGAMAGLNALSWTSRVGTAIVGYATYLAVTLWPARLAAFYPLRAWDLLTIAMALAVLAGVSAAAFAARRRYPHVLVGWLWFLISLAPVVGLFQSGEQATADRFMYVPIIGLLVAVIWTVAPEAQPRVVRRAIAAVAAACVVALALAARAQAATWTDSVTLWEHAVSVTQDSDLALQKLGDALRERGDSERALAVYNQALAAAPAGANEYRALVEHGMGLAFTHLGRAADALAAFQASVELDGHFAEGRLNLGNALAIAGQPGDAEQQFREALRLEPDLVEAELGLGGSLIRQGRAAEAVAPFTEAIRLDPALAEAHNGLGSALAIQGRLDDALVQYREAARLKPALATAHMNMGLVLAQKGDRPAAIAELEAALKADPSLVAAARALDELRARDR